MAYRSLNVRPYAWQSSRQFRHRIDVDDAGGFLDVQPHQVIKRRAARQKTRSRTSGRNRPSRAGRGRRLGVGKRMHTQALRIFGAASWMAETMPTYAPQRQMLPIMYSRICSAEAACPSLTHAIAAMIWPGVQ